MEMSKGGGEVRRLNIIYFLSRTGRVEHPHLIRVLHLAPNGVYLRDVKRWLSELRGEDLAESFAWSYKRRYKAGYLWQDLLDDDLITPISDNEFILKGSEIPSSDLDKKQHQASSWEEHGQPCWQHKSHNPNLSKTSSPSPEIIEESVQFASDSSASMEYSVNQVDKSGHLGEKEYSSCQSSLLNKPRSTRTGTSLLTVPRYKPALSQQAGHGTGTGTGTGRSKSQSTASSILRNLTPCCTVGTKDSVSVPKPYPIKKSSTTDPGPEIRSHEKLGHSARMSEALWNRHQDQNARHSFDGVRDSRKKADSSQIYNLKSVPSAYRPVSCPTCSQCGKPFKPEKLHSHMKSCKGMKMLAKNSASGSGTRDKAVSKMPVISSDREDERNSLLCH